MVSLLTKRIEIRIPTLVLMLAVDSAALGLIAATYDPNQTAISWPLFPSLLIANVIIAIARKKKDRHPFLLGISLACFFCLGATYVEATHPSRKVPNEFALLYGLVELANFFLFLAILLITLATWLIVLLVERRRAARAAHAEDSASPETPDHQ